MKEIKNIKKLEIFENLRKEEEDLNHKFSHLIQASGRIEAYINQHKDTDNSLLQESHNPLKSYLDINYYSKIEPLKKLIKNLTDTCDHEDKEYSGRDSHYDYEKCIYCHIEFKC